MMKKTLLFVTGNKNKLREVSKILGDKFEVVAHDIDLEEIQGTMDEISIKKCQAAAEVVQAAVIVEDTSLCFEAFNGLPGAYVKWFLKEIGPKGLCDMLAATENKKAYARCTFAYSGGPGEKVVLFTGITKGNIVEPRGPTNFGWDPIFQPNEFDQTYAEMSTEVKNSISHRYKAAMQLQQFLEKQ
ncbi:hypothetical protein BB561_003953 [Smittium simulii]|uniref:Inosine triphosphate pyrophosphatase n=1 Tax=Smittium simulii TaxID=133385 RepID=A0A2T9YIS8_9FUNG|nr:hypothetical protein BB561_003953 [Smittium simulii]